MSSIINDIIDFVDKQSEQSELLLINGCFGIGKSYILEHFKNELYNRNNNFVIYDYQHYKQNEYLHEFVYSFAMSCFEPTNIDPKETFINRNRFHELLYKFSNENKNIYNLIITFNKLKNLPQFITDSSVNFTFSELQNAKEYLSKDEYDITFNNKELAAESFIVDLFYRHFDIGRPIKKHFLFIIDNYDSVAGTINDWIFNELINLLNCYFNNLKYFTSQNFPNVKICELFNFKFIIASREYFEISSSNVKQTTITLKPFEKYDIIRYFLNKNIDIQESLDFIYSFTNGIPFLLNLVSEAVLLSDGEISDYSQIESIAVQRAFNYLTETQKDYLRAASFLDEFDEEALEFLPLIKNNYKKAYNFLYNSNEFCEKIHNNKISVKKFIRYLIIRDLRNESPTTAKNFELISELYKNYNNLFKVFDPEERKIIRMLAYFKCFDKIFAIEEVFESDAAAARKIIDKYPILFVERNGLYFVEEKISNAVRSLEELSQTELYETTLPKIQSSWSKYVDILKKELSTNYEELNKLTKNLEHLKHQETELKIECAKLESDLALLSREITEVEILLQKYKHDTNLFYIVIPLIVILFFLINDIYKFIIFDFIYSIIIIVLAALLSINRIIIFINLKKNKGSFNKIKSVFEELRSKKEEVVKKLDFLKNQKQLIIENINIYDNLINKLQQEIDLIKFKINNKFYYEQN